MKQFWGGAIVAAVIFLVFASLVQGVTFEEVRKRGELNCGASIGLSGFSIPDEKGTWSGLDVDFCKAVAAATLGDAEKVKFFPLSDKERLSALYTGDIDILSHNTLWNITNDTALGLNFVGVSYYDGQGFMASKKLGVKSALELDNTTVCIVNEGEAELKTTEYLRKNNLEYRTVVVESTDQMLRDFESGRCDVIVGSRSRLYELRTKLKEPEKGVVLPEVISKEPMGPVVRQGDDAWFNIVRWVLFAMINAEELGMNSANVDDMKSSENPEVRRFLGLEGSKGKGLGLRDDWAYQVVKQVGNYGEIFERNLGQESSLKISRGLNGLWNHGGILYAPPME